MPSALSGRRLITLAAIAALLTVLPLLLLSGGGDLPYHYTLIECFGRQFWQGNFYPRWCMNANAGYGSPMPIFYNLLPYYVTSLFYPLYWLGAGIPTLYVIGVFLAGMLTFAGAFIWLRDMNGNNVQSACCAALLLWLPYRMELLGTRAAYTELWGFALLPFLFYYTRQLACHRRNVWPQLALILTLCLLCHPVTTFMGLIVCAVILLAYARTTAQWLGFAIATMLALTASAFHWYPASQLLAYTGEAAGAHMRNGWANNYAGFYHFDAVHFLWGEFEPIRWLASWHLATMAIGTALGIRLLRQREAIVWCVVICVSLLLFLPISAPLWNIIQLFTHSIAPWRAAMLASFALAALLAMFLRSYPNQFACGALIAAMLTGSAMIQIPPVPNPDARALMAMGQHILPYFNTSQWLRPDYADTTNIFYDRFVFNRPESSATFTQPADVQIAQWNNHTIILDVNASKPGTLYAEQFYFPTWQATVNDKPATLAPEENGAGRMTLALAAGANHIVIAENTARTLPELYIRLCWASLASVLAIGAGLYFYSRRPDA